MRVLGLNPLGAGSHRAFMDGWSSRSRHEWTVVGLPGRNWKWRMRGAAFELAAMAGERARRGEAWDAVVCTDMMNVAEFRGLAPAAVGRLPLVVYFHENQASFPIAPGRGADARDVHFALTNLASVVGADEAWFNSAYNLGEFEAGLRRILGSVPEADRDGLCGRVVMQSRVAHPGVDDRFFETDRVARAPGPLRVVWAARWEWDKAPEAFARAMIELEDRGVPFVVDVLGGGESWGSGSGPAWEAMVGLRERLGPGRVGRFGHADREGYVSALREADAIVSTAMHEFFGLSIVEAVAAGAMAVVPRGLAYPEVLGERWPGIYEGGTSGLVDRLGAMSRTLEEKGSVWEGDPLVGRGAVDRYRWSVRAAALDAGLERVVSEASRA